MHHGLAGQGLSLEPQSQPGSYVTENNKRVVVRRNNNTPAFNNDATWQPVKATFTERTVTNTMTHYGEYKSLYKERKRGQELKAS